jgi:hypothetical protein
VLVHTFIPSDLRLSVMFVLHNENCHRLGHAEEKVKFVRTVPPGVGEDI